MQLYGNNILGRNTLTQYFSFKHIWENICKGNGAAYRAMLENMIKDGESPPHTTDSFSYALLCKEIRDLLDYLANPDEMPVPLPVKNLAAPEGEKGARTVMLPEDFTAYAGAREFLSNNSKEIEALAGLQLVYTPRMCGTMYLFLLLHLQGMRDIGDGYDAQDQDKCAVLEYMLKLLWEASGEKVSLGGIRRAIHEAHTPSTFFNGGSFAPLSLLVYPDGGAAALPPYWPQNTKAGDTRWYMRAVGGQAAGVSPRLCAYENTCLYLTRAGISNVGDSDFTPVVPGEYASFAGSDRVGILTVDPLMRLSDEWARVLLDDIRRDGAVQVSVSMSSYGILYSDGTVASNMRGTKDWHDIIALRLGLNNAAAIDAERRVRLLVPGANAERIGALRDIADAWARDGHYICLSANGDVYADCAIDGQTEPASAIAIGAKGYFYADAGAVYRAAPEGGAWEALAKVEGVGELAAAADALYAALVTEDALVMIPL